MKSIKIILLIIAVISIKVFAQDSKSGVGIFLGEPLGASYKHWLSTDNAIEGHVGYSYLKTNNTLDISACYVFHNFNFHEYNGYKFHLTYGLGFDLCTDFKGESVFGIKTTAGLLLYDMSNPVDYYIEFSPIFAMFPKTNLMFDIGVGARYYFDL